ncbi:MAG: hypothetical protein WCP21_16850 [Armatimonadota bacterium]
MTERFLSTSDASAWLQENYGMAVGAHTLRRLARSGKLKAHRKSPTKEKSWHTFTRETLADYAEARGFTRVS